MLIDLSHTIEHGLVTYRGLAAPIICDYWSRADSRAFYDDGSEFQIGKIEMVANTGTYLDCPFHRWADGCDLAGLNLAQLADLEALIIDARPEKRSGLAIDESFFEGKNLAGKAVLIRTDWSKNWQTEAYFENHPFLTAAAAELLKSQKPALVAIDSYNIDDTRERRRPVHSILLRADILIVEHLTNLENLPDDGRPLRFSAVPPKVKGMGTWPVRAFVNC